MRRAMMSQLRPCEKCGRDYYPLRRGYCHRCDAPWHIPEIQPPLWRVVENVQK